jgi:hypothetical protein
MISWKQVGLVTLISVSCSPITSSPTSSRPRAASTGPSARDLAVARRDSGCATPLPPAARLPRISPPCGMRARQKGTGSPPMTRMRLSPSLIAGRILLHHERACAAAVQRLDDHIAQVRPSADAEDAHAAHAVERLEDDVAVLGVESAHSLEASRVTRVGR